MRIFYFSLCMMAAIVAFWTPETATAAPRTMPGACGSTLPAYSREISRRRYQVTYHRTLSDIIKMYGKVYNSSDIRISKLFSLSDVIAYHIRNVSAGGRWAGVNVVHFYKRTPALQIYVICKKSQ